MSHPVLYCKSTYVWTVNWSRHVLLPTDRGVICSNRGTQFPPSLPDTPSLNLNAKAADIERGYRFPLPAAATRVKRTFVGQHDTCPYDQRMRSRVANEVGGTVSL